VTYGVHTLRRYALCKRRVATAVGDEEIADVWRAKQAEVAGTPLPSAVPHQTELATAGYTAVEDLDGADIDELVAAGLSYRQATAVLAAL
jgi:hypothetical protein